MQYYVDFKNLRSNEHLLSEFSKESLWCYKKIITDIKKLPNKIIKMLIDNNIKLLVSDVKFDLLEYFMFGLESHYDRQSSIVRIYMGQLVKFKQYRYTSVVQHEIGHAIDNILGKKLYNDKSYMMSEKFVGMYKKRALNYYARSDVEEYFAVGFESYFSKYIKDYIGKDGIEHSKRELKTKDLPLYNYIKNLIKS